MSITETETEGAVGGQGTLASNTKNGEFEPAPGNELQFKLRSPRLILPPSPVASEKEEFEPTPANETDQEVTRGQAIASDSELKTPDEFDSLIDRLSESLGIDSSAGVSFCGGGFGDQQILGSAGVLPSFASVASQPVNGIFAANAQQDGSNFAFGGLVFREAPGIQSDESD